MGKEDDKKYQLVELNDGWLDRQLKKVEEVAKWSSWMLGKENTERK
ncbi:MAG: hypothetical protein AABY22_22325 [Nanoarchaeota archaeon]